MESDPKKSFDKITQYCLREHLDHRKDESVMTELRNFFHEKIEATVIAVLEAFGRMEYIISRFPAADQKAQWDYAVADFWAKLPQELQVGLQCRHGGEEEIKEMKYEAFRPRLLLACERGFIIQGKVQIFEASSIIAVHRSQILLREPRGRR